MSLRASAASALSVAATLARSLIQRRGVYFSQPDQERER